MANQEWLRTALIGVAALGLTSCGRYSSESGFNLDVSQALRPNQANAQGLPKLDKRVRLPIAIERRVIKISELQDYMPPWIQYRGQTARTITAAGEHEVTLAKGEMLVVSGKKVQVEGKIYENTNPLGSRVVVVASEAGGTIVRFNTYENEPVFSVQELSSNTDSGQISKDAILAGQVQVTRVARPSNCQGQGCNFVDLNVVQNGVQVFSGFYEGDQVPTPVATPSPVPTPVVRQYVAGQSDMVRAGCVVVGDIEPNGDAGWHDRVPSTGLITSFTEDAQTNFPFGADSACTGSDVEREAIVASREAALKTNGCSGGCASVDKLVYPGRRQGEQISHRPA